MNGSLSVLPTSSLTESLVALGSASQQSQLLETLRTVLQHHTHALKINLTWLTNSSISLPSEANALPAPTLAEQSLLSANQIVQREVLTFVPMLTAGRLRGWVTLQGAQCVEHAHALASQAGLALALLEQEQPSSAANGSPPISAALRDQADAALSMESIAKAYQATDQPEFTGSSFARRFADLEQRNKQLMTLLEIHTHLMETGKRMRAATTIDDVSAAIVAALQALTHSPRAMVYEHDPERQQTKLHTYVGIDPADLANIDMRSLSMVDARKMLQLFTQLGPHLYRLKQPWPQLPLEDCALLLLSNHQYTSVGCAVFDLVAYPGPISDTLIQALEIIADQAASALTSVRLMAEQQHTVDRLMTLNAFSLATASASLSKAELVRMMIGGAIGTTQGICGGALLLDEGDSAVSQECPSPTTCAAAIEAKLQQRDGINTTYIELTNDEIPVAARETGVRSIICVPLHGTNLAMGHLWVGYNNVSVLPTDREMVSLYAKTAGAVLENLHLFEQLRMSHDQFVSILNSTNEGMLMATASGDIVVANPPLGRLLGATDGIQDITTVDALMQVIREQGGDPNLINSALRHVPQDVRTQYAGELHLTTSEQRDLMWSVVPVRGGDTSTQAALLLLRDVTSEHQASKLRQDLTHMVVHDLRAPLANIIASLDLLLKQRVGELVPRQERILEIASESSRHMIDLVNALLDMRRLEQWQFELQRQQHVLHVLVQDICKQFEQVAETRNISIEHTTTALPLLLIDADLVRRVLQNLIDNAIKFSNEGGHVQITAKVVDETNLPPDHIGGQWTLIQVTDQGPGVPEAYRTHIFELFGQAPNGRSQGNGIGLAFCKMAIAAHGGMIWVTDAPEGGAAFCFTLPVA